MERRNTLPTNPNHRQHRQRQSTINDNNHAQRPRRAQVQRPCPMTKRQVQVRGKEKRTIKDMHEVELDNDFYNLNSYKIGKFEKCLPKFDTDRTN